MSKIVLVLTLSLLLVSQGTLNLPPATLTPDHFLYGLDRLFENLIELPLARLRGAESHALVQLGIAEERLSEMDAMVEEGKFEYTSRLLKDYEHARDRSLSLGEGLDSTSFEGHLQQHLRWHISIMEEVRTRIPSLAFSELDMAIERSRSRLTSNP